jgi:DNA-binding response OmpR family regulator
VLADDLDDARELLATALRRESYEVVEARDGAALLATIESLRQAGQTIDAVVADINMPATDGILATRRIRELFPALPIILMTALRDERTLSKAHWAGASAIMQRPFAPAELVALLAELIGE